MKLWTLGTGSNGNAILVECEGERILIDVGFGPRILAGRLRSAGAEPESISACFLTHEHGDHVFGLAKARKRWGWPVFATRGTAEALELNLDDGPFGLMTPGETLTLGRMDITSVRTPHDATESVGYLVTEKRTGARAAVFLDTGHVSRAVRAACADADILVMESNHDVEMLRTGPYDEWLQRRIASRVGHLSNDHAAEIISRSVNRNLNHVVLAHLSEQCNLPRVAMQTTSAALHRTRFRGTLTASRQHSVSGPFVPKSKRAEQPKQMDLFG